MAEEINNKKLKEAQLKDAKLSDEALDKVVGGLNDIDTPVTAKPCLGEDDTSPNALVSV